MKTLTLSKSIRNARLRAALTGKPMTKVKRHLGRKIEAPGLIFDFEAIDAARARREN